MKPKINTLIVDLDNTLYDWFEIWRASFLPVYNGLRDRVGVDETDLQSKIREVHRQRKTSEYTFLLEELQIATPDSADLRGFLEEEVRLSKTERDRALKLYKTVLKTLWQVKKSGTRIVAYTESLSFYSGYRLKKLGLDGVIDYLYCPEDNDLPSGVSLSKIRSLPDEFYELQITEIRHTAPNELKPNPKLLREIVVNLKAKPDECVYVGDSLFKDVAMAQDAGVHDVHAEYGVAQSQPDYELLRKVSHWTDADIAREKHVTERIVTPSHSIEVFSELLQKFDFVGSEVKLADLSANHMIDIWKKVVDVQQHFNQLEMQIRNYALTVTGAIMAAAGITFRDGLSVSFIGTEISLSIGIAAVALTIWAGFWFMDRHWYHRLLKGAVDHATTIEEKFGKSIPEIALGSRISANSPVYIFGFKLGSNGKINLFYGLGAVIILLFGLFAFVAEPMPSKSGKTATAEMTFSKRHVGSLGPPYSDKLVLLDVPV
ncbi:phosphoglycolate phosphatase [Agrobacterium sp. DSM 25558]|uniref:HAD family hydrolase n=1 Tax=Agrobacterium sp. DSM 25558 TaxID=1907665 RepID=UPI0009725296|nr:HAD family hydrolase [Agrobacterium sp. DSM 25558]SCX04099.1 phosphoglycolate phosphatase [Agrobacterium sp. DSM 25558]